MARLRKLLAETEAGYDNPGQEYYNESDFRVAPVDTYTQRKMYEKASDQIMGRSHAAAIIETLAINPDQFHQPLAIADAAERLGGNSASPNYLELIISGMDIELGLDTAAKILDLVAYTGQYGDWPYLPVKYFPINYPGMEYDPDTVPDDDVSEEDLEYYGLPPEAFGAAIGKFIRPEWKSGLVRRLECLMRVKEEKDARKAIQRVATASFCLVDMCP
jgi:hypothetical protein